MQFSQPENKIGMHYLAHLQSTKLSQTGVKGSEIRIQIQEHTNTGTHA